MKFDLHLWWQKLWQRLTRRDQPSEPSPPTVALGLERSKELLALARMLRRAQGTFALAFVRCDVVPLRDQLVVALRDALAPAGVTIHEAELTAETPDLPAALAVAAGDGDPLFVYGLEKAMPASAPEWAQAQLNERRGLYQKLGRPLVFWLPEYALRLVARGAPDFWAWRSGVYDFAWSPVERDALLGCMAVQYEAAGAWQQAAELWAALDRPLKHAEALERYARSLEDGPYNSDERAEAWEAAVRAFEAEGEMERAATSRREVARWLQRPIIALDVQLDEGLVLNAWSRLRFIVHNEGYGTARNLIIRASGDQFEGQLMDTHRFSTLRAGCERTAWLDVRPLEFGDSVPLRVTIEYQNQAGESRSLQHTIYLPVARTDVIRREGGAFNVFVSGAVAVEQIEQEQASLHHRLQEARESLHLIEERKTRYMLGVDIPLRLIKEERLLRERIAELERELNALETARPSLPASAHVLPFNRLSPAEFERLCLWLVKREGYLRTEHLGLAGSEQGRDVVAYKPTSHGKELWYFKCKRCHSIDAGMLKDDVAKYLRLAEEKPYLRPTGVIFVVSCAVSAKVREEVSDYCQEHGLACEFWALTELDVRVKRDPDLLREFFNLAS